MVAGTTYHVAVEGNPVALTPTFTITFGLQAAPANDDFADAEVLADDSSDITGTVLASSLESGEPPNCAPFGGSVWFAWTPAHDGLAAIESPPTSMCLALYEGSTLGTLTPAATIAVGLGGFAYRLAAGTTYHVAVEAPRSPGSDLSPPSPSTAASRRPRPTTTSPTPRPWPTAAATSPAPSSLPAARVASRPTALVRGQRLVRLDARPGRHRVRSERTDRLLPGAVAGATLAGLSPVETHPFGLGSGFLFRAVAGTTYHFAVVGRPGFGSSTSFTISFGFQARPPTTTSPTPRS